MFVIYGSDVFFKIRLAGMGISCEMENSSKEDQIDVIFIYVVNAL